MLLLMLSLIFIVCIVPIVIKVIKSKKMNNKKILTVFSIIIILVIIIFCGVKIYQQLPHNEVTTDDRLALESYILEKYGLELKIKESKIIHRGDIGINPGIEYIFILKNSKGFEYRLSINRYEEIDLKSILKEKPELDLVQMK